MKKRLLSTLLALCMVLTLFPVTAYAAAIIPVTGGNIYFDAATGTLTDCDDPVTEAIIPNEIEGVPVTSLGNYAFDGCGSLTSVTIPDSVTTIGVSTFLGCWALTSVTIPDSVTFIDEGAFYDCTGLTSVTIPDSVTVIEESAFADCSSLTSVTISNSVTSIGLATFLGCSSLTSVTIPDGVTVIGESAFRNCSSLTSVTIPLSVTTVEHEAFAGCSSLADIYYSGSESQWKQISIDNSEYGFTPYDPAGNTSLLNATIHYSDATPGIPDTPSTQAPVVVLSPQNLSVNGEAVACEKYNIDGSNYFKLRDLAFALNGTGSQFDVGYDAATSTVTITTGKAYTPAGGELDAGVDNSASAQPSGQAILIDGVKHDELTAYNIGGSNFFQLRELGNVLGFEVDYDAATNTAIVRSK